MSGNGRFSDEWWEHIWIVSSIMTYKIAVEQEASRTREIQTHMEVDDIHEHIKNVNKKLDIIMKRLEIEEEIPD